MCNSKVKLTADNPRAIDGRAVLQPACNRNLTADPSRTLKKSLSFPSTTPFPTSATTNKRSKGPNSLNSSTEKPNSPKSVIAAAASVSGNNRLVGCLVRKKSKKNVGFENHSNKELLSSSALFDVKAPGSLAAAQREQATILQAQRKMKIAHYGRAPGMGERKVIPLAVDSVSPVSSTSITVPVGKEEKRCSFITPNSDPLYIAYHDEEWGVPVHDDRMLFELLVLSGAQVGLDWTTILRKRDAFRSAFVGFDAVEVSKFTEKQMTCISVEYGIDLGRIRGVVNNSQRIIEVKREFRSLDKYIWGFVNHKPISTQYRSCQKIPVKTSKSESISKDMVRRGFRFVGPTIIHSFMQAAGLTNGHLISCPRHCSISSS